MDFNELIRAEKLVKKKIKVKQRLVKPREMIVKTKEVCELMLSGGWIPYIDDKDSLETVLTDKCLLKRSLLVWDALLNEFDKRDYSYDIQQWNGKRCRTYVYIGTHQIRLAIRQTSKSELRVCVSGKSSYPDAVDVRDSKTALLEDKINDVFVKIYRWIQSDIKREEGYELQRQKWETDADERRIIKAEKDRKNNLLNTAIQWSDDLDKSEKLVYFIEKLSKRVLNQQDKYHKDHEIHELIEMAQEHAEELNPLNNIVNLSSNISGY